jgi:hypothetical protein
MRGGVRVFGALLLTACAGPGVAPGTNGDPSGAAGPPGPDAALGAAQALAAQARTLVGLALDEGESMALLRALCSVAPGRLSGSESAARAVDWGLETMRRIGLTAVRAEPVLVPHWERGAAESCARLAPDGSIAEPLDILALGGSIATPAGGIEAEVIRVRSFDELRARAAEARGRIVFFDAPMPRALASTFAAYGQAVPQRTSGASEAARAGGVFALVRSMTTARDDHPHTGSVVYATDAPRVPTAAISTLDADALAARLAAGEAVRLRIALHCRSLPDAESANVVGEIRGSDLAEQIVTIGGHLDSWDVGEGAHDDGAGCVHALEAARLILGAGLQPRRTIRVVLFMNEENGLRGAVAYAEAHAGEVHFAAIESDRGGFAPLGFTTTARGRELERFRPAADALDPYGMGAMLPGGGGADIGPLAAHGAVLFGLATIAHRYFDYHHSALDRVENVNERELALGAAAVAQLAAALAGCR